MNAPQKNSSAFDIELLNVTQKEIEKFCLQWNIISMDVFGSVAKGNMTNASDIDLLVKYGSDSRRSLLTIAEINIAIEALFGRQVDLVDREVIENSTNRFRKASILNNVRSIYVLR